MKNTASLLFRLILTVCLTVYGPFGMAIAGSDSAVFSMEICANGVSQTVAIDAEGNPVQRSQDCPDCVTCCQATGVPPAKACGPDLTFAQVAIEVDQPFFQRPILTNRHIRPAPRGPPAVTMSKFNPTGLTGPDQPSGDPILRSDGRPIFKDADA